MAGDPVAWLLRGRLGWGRRDVLLTGSVGVVALLARMLPVMLGGGLSGLLGYDDGVYFGGAIALTEGALPYRDYLLLHPPGELVAVLPFAFLGNGLGDDVAFALARLATMALGATGAILAVLIGGRHARIVGLIAGLIYATWNAVADAERSTDLHALQDVLLLVALLVVAQRGRIGMGRATLAGGAMGLATSVQLWQGLPALVLLWWILGRAPRRRGVVVRARPAVAYCAGAALAFCAVCAPFFAAAPVDMVRYVLLDQVARPVQGVGVIERLRVLEGMPLRSQLPAGLRGFVPDRLILVLAAAAVSVLALAARAPWSRLWAVLAAAQAAVVLATPSFFTDYTAYVAPAGSLALGSGLAIALTAAARRRPGIAPGVVTGAVMAMLIAMSVVTLVPRGDRIAIATLAGEVDEVTCVSADYPTLLVVTGALRRDIAAGCMLVLDPTGLRYDTDRGRLLPGAGKAGLRKAAGYQAAMRSWYAGSDAAFFVRQDNAFDEATRAAVEERLPLSHRVGAIEVRRRAP